MPRLTLIVSIGTVIAGCGVAVSPDGSVPVDGSADVLSDHDVQSDAALLPDTEAGRADAVAPLTKSVAFATNFTDGSTRLSFAPRGRSRVGDVPETVAGCRLYNPRRTNIVAAGTVTARGASRSEPLLPSMLRNNELTAIFSPALAGAERLTLTGTGSSEFPAFSVACTMPEEPVNVIAPPAAVNVVWDSREPITVRWTPVLSDDLVRVSLWGGESTQPADLLVDCVGPIDRGALVVPQEVVRLLDEFPIMRSIVVARLRVASVSVDDVSVELWCNNRASYSRRFQ